MRLVALLTVAICSIIPTLANQCSTTEPATEQQQLEAFRTFVDLFLVQKNLEKAFDDYIPGTYINHNPLVQSGRENALAFLRAGWDTTPVIPAAVFFGQGFGLIHHRLAINGTGVAFMDRYRLNGTCIVEHWDVMQPITGNEVNPIAFF